KLERVANFHASTMVSLIELTAAAGLDHPREFSPHHFSRRVSAREVMTYAELYPALAPGELLTGTQDPRFRDAWAMATANDFRPQRAQAATPEPIRLDGDGRPAAWRPAEISTSVERRA